MSQSRVWFDVSYTRTQQGTIGITRTVHRLFASASADGQATDAVAYHSSGFRRVAFPVQAAAAAAPGTAAPALPRGPGDRLFAWATGRMARRLVILALKLLPWPLLRPAWQVSANLTFDALSRGAEPVRFTPGDLLVIADVGWNYPVWRAARAARRQGAAVLLLVYDLMPIRHPEFCFPLVPSVFATFLREMLACADAAICISRATEDDLRAWALQERIALPPTGFFHLGSDAVDGFAAADVRPQVAGFLAGGAGACFAAVGSFEPKKNYPLLVRVFEQLWSRGEQVRLVIAGKETPDCLAFTRWLRSHPEQGARLLTLHDASDAEVSAIYAHCRALVFPSLFEGFGLPLVEARARGCRVIASDIPAFAELADAGVTLFGRNDEQALVRSVLGLLLASAAPPPYELGLTWLQSAHRFQRVAGELLAGR